jgi:hypothetical protein
MRVSVFITIDTEEDTWGQFSPHHNPVENITCLPRLQSLFDRYDAVPTYLVNWPVATTVSSREILLRLRETGRCEIGTHCHPWNTPPLEEKISDKNSMLCNLPPGLVAEKMETLHQRIQSSFSLTPVCFRAGRWGFGTSVAASLCNLGYRVDTSVSPLVNWTKDGGPDFSEAPLQVYRFDPPDILHPKPEGVLLEVPPSVGFLNRRTERCRQIRRFLLKAPFYQIHTAGLLKRLGLLRFRWLCPELTPGPEMIKLSEYLIRSGSTVLNMSFHSTSLLPGKSQFVSDPRQLEGFMNRIEVFLKFAAEKGYSFLPLSQALVMDKGSLPNGSGSS